MHIDWNEIARDDGHRPWAVPERPWAMTMSWLDVFFAHWPVAPEKLEPHLPRGLALDCFEEEAWVSAVAFEMDNTMPRGMTWWPKPMRFLELNLRTYVTLGGEKPGVWFFSLDAASAMAVVAARATFYLPYFHAAMRCDKSERTIDYHSRRTHRGQPQGEFAVRYRPTGAPRAADEGTLSHWLSERYCLYAADSSDTLYRGDINHEPWPLREVEAEIPHDTLGVPLGLPLDEEPALVSFAGRQDVVGWFRRRVSPPEPRGAAETG